MFDAAKLDTFFYAHNTFFVFNGTFIEEPFSYTCYCAFFFLLCCDNPSKWGLQQPLTLLLSMKVSCDNPSKWDLQQLGRGGLLHRRVVITPQNGVFNNYGQKLIEDSEVVITPQNGVFNNP